MKDAHRKASTYANALAKRPPTQGLHYEKGFSFNTQAWQQHGEVLTAHEDAYEIVESAYQEIGRANDVIGWRETGANGFYGVNRTEDDLPAVVSATKAAIDALDSLLGEG